MDKINFTKNQTEEIISFYNLGESTLKIAKKFNCSKQTINKALKNNNIEIKNVSHRHQIYNLNENAFEKIDSHETAYWLGMLTGDGCISEKNEVVLSLQEKDKKHIYRFRDFLKSNHPVKFYHNRKKKDGSDSISHSLYICNAKLNSDLQKHGVKPNKTLGMDFPNIPDEYLSSYILGLIDSDGSIYLKSHYKNKNIKLLNLCFVGPTKFVESLQEILIKKCNISKTKLDDHLPTPFIRIMSYGGYKNIYKIIKYLYSNNISCFERKKDIGINYLLTKFPNDEWLSSNKAPFPGVP